MSKTDKVRVSSAKTPQAVRLKEVLVDEVIPYLTKISGGEKPISTGWSKLDDFINGFGLGELTIIGARPAMGRASLLLCLALNLAKNNKKVLFLSEMSNAQLCVRVISIEGKIEVRKIARTGQLSSEEWARFSNTAGEICELPLYFLGDNTEYNQPFTVDEMEELARELEVDAVFLDYLPEDAVHLKRMAEELNVPVIMTCLLKRPDEHNHLPRPNELMVPEPILQDADVILLLHRDDYAYYSQEDIEHNDAEPVELIVAKANHGHVGVIELLFHHDYIYYTEKDDGFPW